MAALVAISFTVAFMPPVQQFRPRGQKESQRLRAFGSLRAMWAAPGQAVTPTVPEKIFLHAFARHFIIAAAEGQSFFRQFQFPPGLGFPLCQSPDDLIRSLLRELQWLDFLIERQRVHRNHCERYIRETLAPGNESGVSLEPASSP